MPEQLCLPMEVWAGLGLWFNSAFSPSLRPRLVEKTLFPQDDEDYSGDFYLHGLEQLMKKQPGAHFMQKKQAAARAEWTGATLLPFCGLGI